MKKLTLSILATTLLLTGLTACSSTEEAPSSTPAASTGAETSEPQTGGETGGDDTSSIGDTIKIGASPAPHAEILEFASPLLEELGYDLEIIEYLDYVIPNTALDEGSLDANYFQHQPYLDEFNGANNMNLQTVSTVHYEPFGVYPGRSDDLANIEDGASIGVPNDASNEARALLLLEAEGLITLKDGAGINATINDIESNPHNIDIRELEAALLTNFLPDLDFAVINGNYAVASGLSVVDDAVATEDAESISATTYGNILVVQEGNENDPAILALIEVLEGEEVSEFIESNYGGAVLPMN